MSEENCVRNHILITGASGGIGQAIALSLAKEGNSLYLHYNNNHEAIEKLLIQFDELDYEGEFIPIQADLRTEEGCTKLCQEVYQIDGIVHNSGISINKVLTNMQNDEIHELMFLHLTAPILITKHLLPKMIQKKAGNIVFISSIWGQTGASCETVYSAVKGGQIAFAKALSKEVALSNIHVNVVAPGAIRTNMMGILDTVETDLLKEEIPLGRIGSPSEVASVVKFLLSEESSYITGQVLAVNGGWYI